MRSSRAYAVALVAAVAATLAQGAGGAAGLRVQEYAVPPGTHPHDVAPAPDGGVWYTAQATGRLGWLDPATGADDRGRRSAAGSAPHGVIVGPDGAPWMTDGGLNAIVRVDPGTRDGAAVPGCPPGAAARTSTPPTFDKRGHPLVHRPERRSTAG